MNNESFHYEAGVCNIDSQGIRWRKRLGTVALFAGIISMAALYYFHFGMLFRFIIGSGFGFSVALNFLEAKEHFCVMNASRRTFEVSLKRNKIKDDSGKKKDMKKMQAMIGKSLLYALAAGAVGLLPL